MNKIDHYIITISNKENLEKIKECIEYDYKNTKEFIKNYENENTIVCIEAVRKEVLYFTGYKTI